MTVWMGYNIKVEKNLLPPPATEVQKWLSSAYSLSFSVSYIYTYTAPCEHKSKPGTSPDMKPLAPSIFQIFLAASIVSPYQLVLVYYKITLVLITHMGFVMILDKTAVSKATMNFIISEFGPCKESE